MTERIELTKRETKDLAQLITPITYAYHRGRFAAQAGKFLTDCELQGIERKAWMIGYNSVKEEQSQ